MHHVYPPKWCLTIVSDFSWDDYNTDRVLTALKSPRILGKVLEKSLNCCASLLRVFKFSSILDVVAFNVFFDAFWLSKTEYKSLLGEVTFVKVISLHKALFCFMQ